MSKRLSRNIQRRVERKPRKLKPNMTSADILATLPTETIRPVSTKNPILRKAKQTKPNPMLVKAKALRELREAREAGIQPVVEVEIQVPVEPSLEERLQDIRIRKEQQNTERRNSVIVDGFLYLVTNPAHPGWVKVGQTTDYEGRLATYQTASPYADFYMVAIKWVPDRRAAEQKLLDLARMVFAVRGEWIQASIEDLQQNF